MKAELFIFLIFFSSIHAAFFPFNNNINAFRLCIDCTYGPIFTSHKFIFNKKDTVLVHLDGYITFDPCESFEEYCEVIQIYKINSTAKGYIFYEEITNAIRLKNISTIVKSKFEFTAKWAFQLTWYNVYKTKRTFTERMSFQLIITHNDQKSFVIFNYIYLDKNRNISIGYKIGKKSLYENRVSNQLVNGSNIEKKGVWVFELPNNATKKLQLHFLLNISLFILFLKTNK